jgi:hypothetical protein
MIRIAVAVPVIRVQFEVNVVQRARVLSVDTLVLAGVAAGRRRPDAIADDLCLSPRLVDTSVVRLVEEDLLLFNSHTGDLILTDRARTAWKDDRLDQLAFRGEPFRVAFRAAQELTWGSIVPLDAELRELRFGRPPPGAIQLPRADLQESILDLPSSRIAALFTDSCAKRFKLL